MHNPLRYISHAGYENIIHLFCLREQHYCRMTEMRALMVIPSASFIKNEAVGLADYSCFSKHTNKQSRRR